MNIRDLLLTELDKECQDTRKFLALLPAGKTDWKPADKSMTLGRLAMHLAELSGWGNTILGTDTFTLDLSQFKPTAARAAQEALKTFDETAEKFRTALASTTEQHLAGNWKMVWEDREVVSGPRAGVLHNFVFFHMVHHRAQLGVYYRLLGIAIPGVYGPSADDKSKSAAAS